MPSEDVFWSWAWTPDYVRRATQGSSLILLPDSAGIEPALVHFSKFKAGEQYSWLWMFESLEDALKLRLLPSVLSEHQKGGDVSVIESTLPIACPDNYVQIVPRAWVRDLPLEDEGIQEVRIGFNHRNFLYHGMRAACQRYSVSEFRELAAR